MALKLPRLPSGFKIINRDGSPTNDFQLWWQNIASQLEANINAIQTALEAAGIALDAAAAAQAAADAANAAADAANAAVGTVNSEQSLISSGVVNAAGPLSATASGNITVADHQRKYGDSSLNPTVSVTGDTISSGLGTDQTVYVYYDDPTRAGGGVSYQVSIDAADATQGGVRHTVGSVHIPTSGTNNDGVYTPPAGIPPA